MDSCQCTYVVASVKIRLQVGGPGKCGLGGNLVSGDASTTRLR